MLSDYQALLASLVRDDVGVVTPTDIDTAIGLAVTRYSTDFPLTSVADLASNGTATLSLPVDWALGFSAVMAIEYPPNAFPPSLLEGEHYGCYQAPTGVILRFDFVPTETVRVTYGIPHTLSATVDTINPIHREAVVCWAAAWCCDQLAAYYASASDSVIQADHVQRNSQSADYARLAKAYRARYFSGLAIEEKTLSAASSVVDWDLTTSLNQDRFTHPNRRR
jgi:hypothetical protein